MTFDIPKNILDPPQHGKSGRRRSLFDNAVSDLRKTFDIPKNIVAPPEAPQIGNDDEESRRSNNNVSGDRQRKDFEIEDGSEKKIIEPVDEREENQTFGVKRARRESLDNDRSKRWINDHFGRDLDRRHYQPTRPFSCVMCLIIFMIC